MTIYAVTGKLGSGKGKACVLRIKRALLAGRRVATNMDIFPDKLLPPGSKATLLRLPDKPTVESLEMIGVGNDSYDEELNGLIVLDELGSWLNARTFSDKTRQGVIDWLIHSRKLGWDVIFQMQNINQVDKQVREALIEYVVRCVRLDKVKIPVVGGIIKAVTFGLHPGTLPRMHVATVRVGPLADAMIADRWIYRGDDLQDGYDTRQIFTDRNQIGTHSVLSAWHLKGRHEAAKPHWLVQLLKLRVRSPRPALKPKLPHVEAAMALPPDRRLLVLNQLDQLSPI